MAPSKQKWLKYVPQSDVDFQLPDKTHKAIPILTPKPSQIARLPSAEVEIDDEADTNTSYPNTTVVFQQNAIEAITKSIPADYHTPTVYDVRSPRVTLHHWSANSNLDIHSRNYVPLWLRAVNESVAQYRVCTSFPTVNFAAYIETLVGPEFVQLIQNVELPPPTLIQVNEQVLTYQNYSSFWLNQLQNEFAAEHLQLKNLTLYNQHLQSLPGRHEMFMLQVPGLREHAPRVDLGDIIHIRPLEPVPRNVEAQVEYWYKYGQAQGYISPGFSGLIFDPQVWEMDRANERITLRIDGFDNTAKCNIIFLLQESKLEPICRAVQRVTGESSWLRKILFPEVSDGVLQTTLSQASFDIPWVDDLNWEQKKAVYSICSANYGNMPYLISGPPGTGKTKTLVETALQLIREPGHILICAPSDAAADTLALRLSQHLKPDELFRLNGWTRTFAEVPDRLLLYTHSSSTSFSLPPVEKMLSFRIVVTTCRDADLLNRARLSNMALSSLYKGVRRLLAPDIPKRPLHWSALLLDEAAQATEPDVLIPLSLIMPPDEEESPQFVAAGDQYQLGPKLASKSCLDTSLFQRLFNTKAYADHPLSRTSGNPALTSKLLPIMRPAFTNLVRNYRSHPAILAVPSSLFYNDSLIPERKASEEILTWPGWPSPHRWPVLFQHNDTEDTYESIVAGDGTGTGTVFNPGEAITAVRIASSLLEHASQGSNPLAQSQIMVMSPFRAQVTQLRKSFRQNKLFEVNIGPLEAFQGLESRIVILCTTRTRLGIGFQSKDYHVGIDKSRALGVIDKPRKLNVAMTRAQEGLIVIGNAHCLVSTGDQSWLQFLSFSRRNDCFRVPVNFSWPALGDLNHRGRLERALLYAAQGKAYAEEGVTNSRNTQPATPSASRFRLKGSRKDMDEEMWQFKELAQHHDSEYVDMVLEMPLNMDTSSTEGPRADGAEKQEFDDDYDRNLSQEFHRECNTQ